MLPLAGMFLGLISSIAASAYLAGQSRNRIGSIVISLVGITVATAIWFGTKSPVLAAMSGSAAAFGTSAAWRDFGHRQISDLHSGGILLTGLVAAPILHPYETWLIALGGSVLALAVLILARTLVRFFKSQEGLGAGDLGFAAACGCWAGLGATGPALLIAVIVTYLISRLPSLAGTEKIPFAPGLFLGFSISAFVSELAPL